MTGAMVGSIEGEYRRYERLGPAGPPAQTKPAG